MALSNYLCHLKTTCTRKTAALASYISLETKTTKQQDKVFKYLKVKVNNMADEPAISMDFPALKTRYVMLESL
jgi:hypothetical protein